MPIPKLSPTPGESYDASQKPPPFGHPLKQYFALDDDYVNLNHGSYGSLPLPLIFAVNKWNYEIERNPDVFHRLTYQSLLDKSRAAVAKLIGAETDEVVLVPNATHALNIVLRNFEWREGDLLIGASTTYGAVGNTIRYLADRSEQPRPAMVNIEYNFPLTHAQIIDLFRAKIREVKHTYANVQFTDVPPLSAGFDKNAVDKKNKIVMVIDSITANPGALMPWQEMCRIAREEGVWTVVDGAHSIGQEYNINLSEAKPDFWLSNCHKWLYAKRGCAVLYAPKRNQYIIKSSIPTSYEYVSPSSPAFKEKGTNFVMQHEWTGTMDETQFITVPDALAFREWLGGEKAIYDYCHQLAMDGGKKLAEVVGTRVLDEDGELTATMSNVQLPLPVEKKRGEVYTTEQLYQINNFLKEKLLKEWKTYAAHYWHNGAWWCRCSAQVFNELSDFEYLGKAFNAVCKEAEETILKKSV
ncbi:PLP-dependent transferase [Lentinus tigrinus ALCF2SS1-7]|uniref:PLP-dependent transferase n=1 Tax=Lentinus tigrinus ALCF2SS1-6 TaxID=1328759 RepID=A0A5C2SF69_9APHY|nr:PLP-dependent transferase [Lentinus tigrinus ALCF2SS1-6]RPD74709.1 PLP-dependent transferase [Lentinus tigrinus ALCF2SS1-7]